MRRLVALVLGTLVLALLSGPAGAITNGRKDVTDRYPFVGLLAFYDAEGEYMHRCTGTLLSPTFVLTAAHCTEDTATAYAYFSVDVPDDFRENPTGKLGATFTHPDFGPSLHDDVGAVLLDDPVNLGVYPVLAPEGFLADLKAEGEIKHDRFVAVGYGLLDGFPPPRLEANESRWFASSPYRGLKKNNLHLFQNPVPNGAGGTCFGDSGGPHFWNDMLILVSVTSWGDAVCRSNDQTQRVDIPSVLDWLEDTFGVTPA